MSDQEIDREIDKIRLYVHGYIEVAFERPQQRWVYPRTRSGFEKRIDIDRPHMMDALRLHPDRTTSAQPCCGASASIDHDVVGYRHYWTIYGVEFGHTPWKMLAPKWMQ